MSVLRLLSPAADLLPEPPPISLMIPPYFLCGFYGLVGLVIFAGGFVIGTRWGGKFKFFSPRRKETPEEPAETEEVTEPEA